MRSVIAFSCSGIALERLERAAFDDRNLVAGKLVLGEQVANFHFDEVEQFRVIDHVHLVHEDDDRRHTDLAGQQDVLAGLRHRTVGASSPRGSPRPSAPRR